MDLCSEWSKAETGTSQAERLHGLVMLWRQGLSGHCSHDHGVRRGWHSQRSRASSTAVHARALVMQKAHPGSDYTLLQGVRAKGTHGMPFCKIVFWSIIAESSWLPKQLRLSAQLRDGQGEVSVAWRLVNYSCRMKLQLFSKLWISRFGKASNFFKYTLKTVICLELIY